MATIEDYERIVKGVDNMLEVDADRHKKWMDTPYGDKTTGLKGVDENLLPPAKAQYALYARWLDDETIKAAMTLRPKRIEPSDEGYKAYMEGVAADAKKPGANVLSI